MGFKGDGKIVARLRFGDHDADVAIPVRLVQETKKVERSTAPYKGKGSKPRQTSGCMFRVYWEEIGIKVKCEEPDYIEATDIETLRAAVMDRLNGEHEIEWEEWLLVTVSAGYGHHVYESNVEFGWERAYIAHLPDGRTVHRTSNYRSDQIMEGIPETGKTRRGDTKMVGLVKATPENAAALEELKRRLDDLRDRMMDFLSPKKIEETLATAVGRLLPMPPGKVEKHGRGSGRGAAGDGRRRGVQRRRPVGEA